MRETIIAALYVLGYGLMLMLFIGADRALSRRILLWSLAWPAIVIATFVMLGILDAGEWIQERIHD